MKRMSIIAVLILVLMVSALAGCNPATINVETNDSTDSNGTDGENKTPVTDGEDQTSETNEENDNDETQHTDEYVTVGKIIEFKENTVTVLAGDIAKDYTVDAANAKEFYIDETVGVIEIAEGNYQLERYTDADPTVRFTSGGYRIMSVSGIVKEAGEEKLVITTDDGELSFDISDDVSVSTDVNVIVDYFELKPNSDDKVFLAVYDEASKMSLTIKSIERTETGYMQITTVDDNDMEYIVFTVSGTVLNCSHADFAEGDAITIYPGEIREVSLTEIDAKMILK